MDTSDIIKTLKTTPYKFTYAHKVIDYLKKDNDGDADEILGQLRMKLYDPANNDISKPLNEVVRHFKKFVT